MSTEITNDTIEDIHAHVGPGNRLRTAREAAQLTVAMIADHLHLTTQLIRDIENDDYRRELKPVFLRGYLRSYAKLLGLDGNEIVTEFNNVQLTEESGANGAAITCYKYEAKKSLRRGPWISAAISLVLLSLFVFWFHHHNTAVVSNKISHAILPSKIGNGSESEPVAERKLSSRPLATQTIN